MFRASRHVFRRVRTLGRRQYATVEKEAAGKPTAKRSSPFSLLLQGTVGGALFYGLGCTYETYGVDLTGMPLPVEVGRMCSSGLALFYAAYLPGSIARRAFSCVAAVFYGAGLSEIRQNKLSSKFLKHQNK